MIRCESYEKLQYCHCPTPKNLLDFHEAYWFFASSLTVFISKMFNGKATVISSHWPEKYSAILSEDTVILFIPLSIISIILEFIAVLVQKGGILRIVIQKI